MSTRPRLLIVDDDAKLAKTLGMLLQDDHVVEVSTHPRRALELLLAGSRYDLIFCDLMMPEMSGAAFYAALAERAPEQAARIVFMTGGAFTDEAQAFLASVPNARLEKPFHKEQLDELLARLIGPASAPS